MSDRSNIVSLIDGWETLSDFARDAGVTYGAAKKMRKRQSVPVSYWPALIDSERGQKIGLDADTLVRLHTSGKVASTAPSPKSERTEAA